MREDLPDLEGKEACLLKAGYGCCNRIGYGCCNRIGYGCNNRIGCDNATMDQSPVWKCLNTPVRLEERVEGFSQQPNGTRNAPKRVAFRAAGWRLSVLLFLISQSGFRKRGDRLGQPSEG